MTRAVNRSGNALYTRTAMDKLIVCCIKICILSVEATVLAQVGSNARELARVGASVPSGLHSPA